MITVQKPEEVELVKKKEQLSVLEIELAQHELDLETLKGTLRSFESKYLRKVGVLLAELDDVEARIAEAVMNLNPNDTEVKIRATEADAKARESAEAVGDGRVDADQASVGQAAGGAHSWEFPSPFP